MQIVLQWMLPVGSRKVTVAGGVFGAIGFGQLVSGWLIYAYGWLFFRWYMLFQLTWAGFDAIVVDFLGVCHGLVQCLGELRGIVLVKWAGGGRIGEMLEVCWASVSSKVIGAQDGGITELG